MLGVGKGRKHRTAPPEVSTTARSILQSPPQKHGIKLAEIVVTAIFAILPVLPFVPVVWKVILSLLAWGGFWHLMSKEVEYSKVLQKQVFFERVGLVTLWIGIVLWTTTVTAWKSEQASIMTGELEVGPSNDLNSKPLVQVGPEADGTKWIIGVPNGDPWITIWGDELLVRKDNGKILITTHVRDRNGSSVVVDIVDNKWTVSSLQNISWDKNYTNNALEVKDGRDRVVFQVVLLPDVVRVQGEWWTEDKRGLRLVRPYPFDRVRTGPVFVEMNGGTYKFEFPIEPIFKYPSVVSQ